MRPIDDFYYLKNNKVLFQADSLIQVYQPIIGSDAMALYQYLVAFNDSGVRIHKFSEILNHLQFGMPKLEEALVMLTSMNLLTFYKHSESYLFVLKTALDLPSFLGNSVYKQLLIQKIGDLAVKELEMHIPNHVQDLSKSFSEVFGIVSDNVKASQNPTNDFDMDSFQHLMQRDGLHFENQSEDVVNLYSISSKYKMTWFETYQLAKETAINSKISPKRMLVKKGQKQELGQGQFSDSEIVVIKEAKENTALAFLQKIKRARRATVTKDERNLLLQLAEMSFLDEVINIMVLYTFNKTKSANLQKNYLLKIANDFSYQGISNAEEATLQLRAFSDKKESGQKKGKQEKTNIPEWSNPDYKEEITKEKQEELDKYKKEMLQRLERLNKGGD